MITISPYVIPGIKSNVLTAQAVLDQVCLYRKHNAKMVKSKTRKREYVITRQLYCYLAREYTNNTLADIGMTINRDHATVLYCIQECKNEYHLKPILEEFKKSFRL